MKKILAIVLMIAMMTFLACAAFASGEAPAAAAPAADSQTPFFEWRVITPATATSDGLEGLYGADGVLYYTRAISALGVDDNFAAWKEYLKAYAVAGAPNEEEGLTVAGLIDAAATAEEKEAKYLWKGREHSFVMEPYSIKEVKL